MIWCGWCQSDEGFRVYVLPYRGNKLSGGIAYEQHGWNIHATRWQGAKTTLGAGGLLGLVEPVHDAFHAAAGAADPLEPVRERGIGIRAGRRVPVPGAVAHHCDGVVEVRE